MTRQGINPNVWARIAIGLVALLVIGSSLSNAQPRESQAATAAAAEQPPPTMHRTWTATSSQEKPVAPTPVPRVLVAVIQASALNVRKGPGTGYDILGTVSAGTKWLVVGTNRDGTWLAIPTQDGGIAWISGGAEYTRQTRVQADSHTYELWQDGIEQFRYYAIPHASLGTRPTQWSAPSSLVAQQTVCNCSGNLYNCTDFGPQQDGQACYRYCLQVTGYDVHRLDGDSDGVACEANPLY